jgi:hypothetical protein
LEAFDISQRDRRAAGQRQVTQGLVGSVPQLQLFDAVKGSSFAEALTRSMSAPMGTLPALRALARNERLAWLITIR